MVKSPAAALVIVPLIFGLSCLNAIAVVDGFLLPSTLSRRLPCSTTPRFQQSPLHNNDDDDDEENLHFDDFDFTIGDTSSSRSSSTTPMQLQERILKVQQDMMRKDSQLAKNWRLGNWSVRGFSLDKRKATTDTTADDSSTSKAIHVCKVTAAGPEEVVVGRTDGSVCVVELGTEYWTPFRSKLSAQETEDSIQIQSQLQRDDSQQQPDESTKKRPFQVLQEFQAHDEEISALCLADLDDDGGGRVLFTACQHSGDIRAWSVPDDDEEKVVPLRTLSEAHSDTVVSLETLSLNPENDEPHLLCSASLDGSLALWDLQTGDLIYKCQMMSDDDSDGGSVSITCAAVDRNKSILYVGTHTGHVVGYFVKDMIACASVGDTCPIPSGRFLAHEGGVTALQCAGEGTLSRTNPGAPSSSLLLTGGTEGVVKQWEVFSRTVGTSSDTTEPARKLEHWPRLENQRMQKRAHLFRGHRMSVTALLAADPFKFLSAAADGTVRAWNPKTGKEMFRMDGFTDSLSSLCLTDDDQLITDGMEEFVCLHDFDVDDSEVEEGYELEW